MAAAVCLSSAVALPALASPATVSPGHSAVTARHAGSPLLLITGQRLAVRQLAGNTRGIALLAGAGRAPVSMRPGRLNRGGTAGAVAPFGGGAGPRPFNCGAPPRARD